jgi:hypothetical protein
MQNVVIMKYKVCRIRGFHSSDDQVEVPDARFEIFMVVKI